VSNFYILTLRITKISGPGTNMTILTFELMGEMKGRFKMEKEDVLALDSWFDWDEMGVELVASPKLSY
jgi:hypothetical protein